MNPLAVIGLAFALSTSALAAQAELTGCSDPVALDLSGPRPKLGFTVANGNTGTAIFDTGSRGPIADLPQAKRLGLVDEGPLGPSLGRHGAGAYRSTLRGLTIGRLVLGDVPLAVFPTMLPGVDLVLGPQMFSGRLVELDMGAATLRICETSENLAALGEATPYKTGDFPLPAVSLVIGEQRLLANLDTGSPLALTFPMSFAKSLPLADPPVKVGMARGHAGESPVFKARLQGAVRVGPVVLESPEVRFTDVLPGPNVGTGLLQRLVITIDAAGQRSWIRES